MEAFTAGEMLEKGIRIFLISGLTYLNSLEGLSRNRFNWA